jgi:hypothetical protein
MLKKPGFQPLTFKVIPEKDKDVVVSLKRASSRPSPVAGPAVAPVKPGAAAGGSVPARYTVPRAAEGARGRRACARESPGPDRPRTDEELAPR